MLTFNKASTPREQRAQLQTLNSKPKLSEPRGGSLFGGGGLEPAHGPTAADTTIKISPEHMSQQPGPAFTGRARVVSLGVELGEQKLVARSRRRLESGRILWRLKGLGRRGPQKLLLPAPQRATEAWNCVLLPECPKGHGMQTVPKARARLTIIEYDSSHKTLTYRFPEFAKTAEVCCRHGGGRFDFHA